MPMIGKSERGPVAIEAIKKHKSAYLMAVGGAAYLVAKAIKAAKVVGFGDLGMSDLSISLEALERSRSQLSVTSYFDEGLFHREMDLVFQHGPRYVGHAPR